MSKNTTQKASTNNQRQARRREREKQWLKEHGWKSWEALHTTLMNGMIRITSRTLDVTKATDDSQVSYTKKTK